MTTFTKLTPNLLVADVGRSLAFYTDVLGFERGFTVPEQSPFVFGSVVSGPIEIFFNERETAAKEYPAFAGKPVGLTGTMFIELEGAGNIERLHDRLKTGVPVVMPLVTQWYGVKEFAIADPDGYVITFAERVAADPASA
jgi:catechol 2,3-dioxygenase-like lactoylglutathione lyase family enzyme